MNKYDVIIVGGGASGLACAVRLATNSNLKVLIIEAGERVGKKLAATGNGQGNLSNTHIGIKNYRSGNLAVVERIACGGTNVWSDGLDIFGPTLFSADDRGRVYPSGRQASALVDALLRNLKNTNVELLLSTKVTDIKNGFEVTCDNNQKYFSKYLVLAAGGKAQKQFKTDGSAYKLAQNLGHSITPLYPSLVQLKTDTTHIKTLKGIRTECKVFAKINGHAVRTEFGDLIFTEYGVSGNAIFAVSPAFSADGGILIVDLLPNFSFEEVVKVLCERRTAGVQTADLLSGIVHNQIGRAVIKRASTEDIPQIVQTLKNFTLEVTGTLGFDYAQVTRGGVDMREVSVNLESKLVKNLFFTGEILDVDGDCGGYNLHWAFTSAQTVAKTILSELK